MILPQDVRWRMSHPYNNCISLVVQVFRTVKWGLTFIVTFCKHNHVSYCYSVILYSIYRSQHVITILTTYPVVTRRKVENFTLYQVVRRCIKSVLTIINEHTLRKVTFVQPHSIKSASRFHQRTKVHFQFMSIPRRELYIKGHSTATAVTVSFCCTHAQRGLQGVARTTHAPARPLH